MTGPIIFGHPTARGQLVDHGEVVTFRTSERTTGSTWWRESRTGPKQGDVTVELIGPADATEDDLAEYAELSGFESWQAWRDAIVDVHGGETSGYLYRATLDDEPDAVELPEQRTLDGDPVGQATLTRD